MIPYTTTRRADTGVTNVTLGVWLFIASEIMLFGALFSSYALLRVSAVNWPSGREVLSLALGGTNTAILLLLSAAVWRARAAADRAWRSWLGAGTILAAVFLAIKTLEYAGELGRGMAPRTSTFLAMYFTLTGFHALHVLGGIVANVWAMAGAGRVGADLSAGRVRALVVYWTFVDLVWLTIFVLMYLS